MGGCGIYWCMATWVYECVRGHGWAICISVYGWAIWVGYMGV